MKEKTAKLKSYSSSELIKIITFAVYNICYVLNVCEYIDTIYNYGTLIIFVCVCIADHIKKNHGMFKIKYKSDLMNFIIFMGFVFVYSIGVQIYHQEFGTYLYSSLLYLLLPMIIAYCWMVSTDSENMDIYFYIFFIRIVLIFLIRYSSILSLNVIRLISWGNSKSSLFESNLAHDFLFMTLFFKYKKKNKLALVSTILCLLSFKRLSFLLSLMILLLYRFIPQKKCEKNIKNVAIAITLIMPIFYGWIISKAGQNFFSSTFNINLDQLFTGRIYSINKWLNNIPYTNGYGSISYFINIGISTKNKLSMHCDLYQLMLECSIIAVYCFGRFIFKFVSNYYSFFLAIYIVLELFSSQFFINLSFWMCFYMFEFYMRKDTKVKNNEKLYKIMGT